MKLSTTNLTVAGVILLIIVLLVACQFSVVYYLGNTHNSDSDQEDSTSSTNIESSSYLSTYDLDLLSKAKLATGSDQLASLETEIRNYLDTDLANYAVYLQDLSTDQTVEINSQVVFSPASIAKVPVAILVLRDIDAGKYTFDTTYPMYNSQKFSFIGELGELPDATPVTIRRYLELMIQESDNNAWYALVNFLGKSYEVVNPRTIEELGVNPFFLDPHDATAANVGKVFADLYNASTLSKTSSDYLISLMENADESLQEGIGSGLPTGIKFANKIGFLDTDTELSYQDAAIVFGPNTNYVLVILDKNQDWEVAKLKLKDISKMVYDFLND